MSHFYLGIIPLIRPWGCFFPKQFSNPRVKSPFMVDEFFDMGKENIDSAQNKSAVSTNVVESADNTQFYRDTGSAQVPRGICNVL